MKRRLLQGSELKVAEIAKRCGFSTVEYFSAAFKKEVGVSPSEFRRPLFQKLASTTRIC
jgi:AraC-like DNA-binding protein